MKKVATRAELAAITGGKVAALPIPSQAPSAPPAQTLDPNIAALQMQVSDITRAVGEVAQAMQAKMLAESAEEAQEPAQTEEVAQVKRKWRFTVQRASDGTIKSITAEEI